MRFLFYSSYLLLAHVQLPDFLTVERLILSIEQVRQALMMINMNSQEM